MAQRGLWGYRSRNLKLWSEDEQTNRWAAALGRHVSLFNRLEVHAHGLAHDLLRTADSRSGYAVTSQLQMNALISLIDRLLDPEELRRRYSDRPTPYLDRVVRRLRDVNDDRNQLIHSVHNFHESGGRTVRRIISDGQEASEEEWQRGAWRIERIEDAYDKVRETIVDIHMTRTIARMPEV